MGLGQPAMDEIREVCVYNAVVVSLVDAVVTLRAVGAARQLEAKIPPPWTKSFDSPKYLTVGGNLSQIDDERALIHGCHVTVCRVVHADRTKRHHVLVIGYCPTVADVLDIASRFQPVEDRILGLQEHAQGARTVRDLRGLSARGRHRHGKKQRWLRKGAVSGYGAKSRKNHVRGYARSYSRCKCILVAKETKVQLLVRGLGQTGQRRARGPMTERHSVRRSRTAVERRARGPQRRHAKALEAITRRVDRRRDRRLSYATMQHLTSSVDVPALVRIKPGVLDRLGVYAGRAGCRRLALVRSAGLPKALLARARRALADVEWAQDSVVREATLGTAAELLAALPARCDVLMGLGGGRALDLAKHVASIAGLPFFAVPTSLSHDGFASPLASLATPDGRRTLACRPPSAVLIDTAVCLEGPSVLWHSGVGDLVAKVTAVTDWKLAYHATGEPVNDLAALLSDASVFQFAARPLRDLEGMRLLATALMLNGVAMSLAGTSRPASGSEHLISHALDQISARPRLHGLQVGLATYVVAHLQGGQGSQRVADLLDATGFFDAIAADPFSRTEWERALGLAPSVKPNFHTILSEKSRTTEAMAFIAQDGRLARCFVDP